jgi:2-oxoisovalerate dehydrogenase E1 component beta subunit
MHHDPAVIIMGEDVGMLGGVFRATDGLLDEFGAARVIDSPLEELGIAGVAIGAAMSGLRPVVEMQFADYIHPAYDQIVNEAAKICYRSNGAFSCPVVIRAPCGAGVHGGMYHSQSVEALFVHVPGLKVVVPSTPYDCKGLLKSAIRDDDPVLFFEHKRIYRAFSGEVPENDYTVPLGRADVKRAGDDLSVITYGIGVHLALEACQALEQAHGISAEILDLRTVAPLDADAICATVAKTGRALLLHEDNRTLGVGAEVAALIAEECFDKLDGPVLRVTAADTHIPFARTLEAAVLPTAEDVVLAARHLVGR